MAELAVGTGDEQQQAACKVLDLSATSADTRAEMAASGMISLLLALQHGGTEHCVRLNAAAALANLTMEASPAASAAASTAVVVFTKILQSSDLGFQVGGLDTCQA